MKGQFQSSESLVIYFPPFIDKTTSEEVLGSDICTITVKKPNGTLVTYNNVSSPAVTFDSDVGLWILTLTTGVFAAGHWKVTAVSNAANTLPQRKVLVWGDFVNDISTGAASAATAAAQSIIARKVLTGRWKIDTNTNQLKFYDENGTTVLYTFALKDENGDPTATRIFERTP